MSKPIVEVTSTTNGTFPSLPLPQSNAHLAPVAPTLEAEGVATTYRNLLPESWSPYALVGAVLMTTVGQELMNPAPWTTARVGATLIGLGATALAWLTKAPQVSTKPKP